MVQERVRHLEDVDRLKRYYVMEMHHINRQIGQSNVRKADRIVVAQRTLVPESVPVLGLGLAAEDSVSLSWVFAYPHCSL
jgi:hypothetical protein